MCLDSYYEPSSTASSTTCNQGPKGKVAPHRLNLQPINMINALLQLLGAPGIATRSKDASRLEAIA